MTTKTPGAASGARAATISLGGDARAHPDLEPLIRPLFAADLTPTGDGETVPLIQRHPNNARRGDHDAIVKSIRNNGVYSPIKVQRSTGYVLAGNHTLDAILDQGGTSAPWVWLDVDDDEARRIMLDDNHVGDLGGYDDRMLLESLRAAEAAGDLLLSSYSVDDIGDLEAALAAAAYTPPVQTPSLADRFLVPPFTVLDARSGAWQDRKRRWLALGIQSEVGRGETQTGPQQGYGALAGDRSLGQGLHAATLDPATTIDELTDALRAAEAVTARHRLSEGAVYASACRRYLLDTGRDWRAETVTTATATWAESDHRLRITDQPGPGWPLWACSCGARGTAEDHATCITAHAAHVAERTAA